jgi:hypothetical protein
MFPIREPRLTNNVKPDYVLPSASATHTLALGDTDRVIFTVNGEWALIEKRFASETEWRHRCPLAVARMFWLKFLPYGYAPEAN